MTITEKNAAIEGLDAAIDLLWVCQVVQAQLCNWSPAEEIGRDIEALEKAKEIIEEI